MVLIDRSLINGAITETYCFKLGEKFIMYKMICNPEFRIN